MAQTAAAKVAAAYNQAAADAAATQGQLEQFTDKRDKAISDQRQIETQMMALSQQIAAQQRMAGMTQSPNGLSSPNLGDRNSLVQSSPQSGMPSPDVGAMPTAPSFAAASPDSSAVSVKFPDATTSARVSPPTDGSGLASPMMPNGLNLPARGGAGNASGAAPTPNPGFAGKLLNTIASAASALGFGSGAPAPATPPMGGSVYNANGANGQGAKMASADDGDVTKGVGNVDFVPETGRINKVPGNPGGGEEGAGGGGSGGGGGEGDGDKGSASGSSSAISAGRFLNREIAATPEPDEDDTANRRWIFNFVGPKGFIASSCQDESEPRLESICRRAYAPKQLAAHRPPRRKEDLRPPTAVAAATGAEFGSRSLASAAPEEMSAIQRAMRVVSPYGLGVRAAPVPAGVRANASPRPPQ